MVFKLFSVFFACTNTICEKMGWASLLVISWVMLKNFIDLLEPCAAFTQLVRSDVYATFTSAIPCIKELKLHLENCSGMTGLNGVTTPMLEDLKRRFNFMFDERDPDFDCSYLPATCLDVITEFTSLMISIFSRSLLSM